MFLSELGEAAGESRCLRPGFLSHEPSRDVLRCKSVVEKALAARRKLSVRVLEFSFASGCRLSEALPLPLEKKFIASARGIGAKCAS